jgi:short-subunit dehydrogenase involved in D-alanine esterification of teichoic acids
MANANIPFRSAIVTGASSGIGRELAMQLAAQGVDVVAIGRDAHRLAQLAAGAPRIRTLRADLAQLHALPALAADILALAPGADCLIHNAAVQHDWRFDTEGSTPAAIEEEIGVNLLAPLVLTRLLLPHLQSREAAWVVCLGSGLADVPKRTAAVYSAGKAGLRLFAQALALQCEGTSLRVVEAVMPLVDTPMTAGRGRRKISAERAARELIQGLAAGRDPVYVGKARFLPLLRRLSPALLALAVRGA